MESLRGQLLVAAPALIDPNFHRTVVLIAEHDAEGGSMGIVLNRPTETKVGEAVPDLAALAGEDAPIHVGGPVQQTAVLALAEFEDPAEAGQIAFGDVGLLPPTDDLDALAERTRRARVFVGYAGWSAGQLEAELEEDGWIVAQAAPDDVFAHDADALWSTVLARQGGQYTLVARMPPDPSLN